MNNNSQNTIIETKKHHCNRIKNGVVAIGVDKGMLRLQFPSKISQQFWKKTQKYLYLKLTDTRENRLVAELVATKIQLDIVEEEWDITLEKYLQILEEHKPKPKVQETNIFNDFLPKKIRQTTLFRLFEEYCKYKKNLLAETTYIHTYKEYAKAFSKCSQNLDNGLEIRAYILENHSLGKAKGMMSAIANMVEWAKLNKLLPGDFLNVYKLYANDITVKYNCKPPISIQKLIDDGILEEADPDFRAYTIEEANAIIQAFEERVCINNYNGSPWDLVVKFLFGTGCRHGECAGLQWREVPRDCSKILFKFSYDHKSGIRKGLKTEGKGVKSRVFHCGPKLQNLLLNIRPDDCNLDSYVFSNRQGKPVNLGTLHSHWAGTVNRKVAYVGILPTLIKEGKVKLYLSPYATRHTYINVQLNAGMKAADVAKLVGNSAATIHKYYESISRETIQPVEI